MPAEWAPHEATWLAWPKNSDTWPDRIAHVQEIFLDMAAALMRGEEVRLLVDGEEAEAMVLDRWRSRGGAEGRLALYRIPTVDAWIRDYGPNFLVRRDAGAVELAFNHWGFNAWGGKYAELAKDAGVIAALAPFLRVPRFSPGIVLEGGSIDVNGAGTCLTTEQCLLNPNRNPGLGQADLERCLRGYLGVETVVWLGEGIAGDDTDGHVDDVARFVSADTIVCALEEDPADENYAPLRDNYARLRQARSPDGKPFRIVPLPMPDRLDSPEGRLPASYANFYIANGVVAVPVFRCARDSTALSVLRELFPRRRVVGINCEPLVWGLGALHCVTQQQPASNRKAVD